VLSVLRGLPDGFGGDELRQAAPAKVYARTLLGGTDRQNKAVDPQSCRAWGKPSINDVV